MKLKDIVEICYGKSQKQVEVENIPHWGLSELVRKATQKEQSNRYQNAQEMLDDFEQLKDLCDKPNEPKPQENSIISIPTWLWPTISIIGVAVDSDISKRAFKY